MEVQILEELYYMVYLLGEWKSKEEFLKMCMPDRMVPEFLSLLNKNMKKVVFMGAEEGMEKVKMNKNALTVEVFTNKIPVSVHMECEYTDLAKICFI